MINKINRNLSYPVSLLLSIDGHKACENLVRVVKCSGDTMLRLINDPIVTMEQLIKICQETFQNKLLYLIIDDTFYRRYK